MGIWALRRRDDLGRFAAVIRFDALVLTGVALWTAYYALAMGQMRFWYHGQLAILVYAVFLPFAGAILFRAVPRVAAIAAPALALLVALPSGPMDPFAPQEYDKYRSALAADEYLAAHSIDGRVGAFNTGIYDYFTKVDVLNLDGVVNPGAVAAIRKRDLASYLRRMNVRYLIEHEKGTAANFYLLYLDPRVRVRKITDLSQYYVPFAGTYAKRTYLWAVEFREGMGID